MISILDIDDLLRVDHEIVAREEYARSVDEIQCDLAYTGEADKEEEEEQSEQPSGDAIAGCSLREIAKSLEIARLWAVSYQSEYGEVLHETLNRCKSRVERTQLLRCSDRVADKVTAFSSHSAPASSVTALTCGCSPQRPIVGTTP